LSPTGYQSIQSRRSQVGLLLLLSPGQFLFNLLLLQPSSGQLLLHLLLLKLSPCKLLLNLLLLYPPSGQLLLDLLLLLLSPAQLFPHLLLLELSPRKLGLQLTQLGRSCLRSLSERLTSSSEAGVGSRSLCCLKPRSVFLQLYCWSPQWRSGEGSGWCLISVSATDGPSQVVKEAFLLFLPEPGGGHSASDRCAGTWLGLTKVLQVQQLLRDLLRRRLRLGLPVDQGPHGSPSLLTGYPVGGESGGERSRGGERVQVGRVVEPATRPLHLLLALARQTDGAEDEAGAAGLSAGTSCDAEVELVAPVGVGVPRVLVGRTLRAGELVQGTGGAAGPVCLVCVITQTFAGVEHEAAGTGLRVRCAIRAVNELVTDGVVWVGEVAISSGTSRAGLGGLKVLPPCAVNSKGEAALSEGCAGLVKHETVRAEVLRHLAVRTLVVSVALERVSEEAILLRALRHVVVVTLGCHSHQETQKDVEPGHVGSDVSVTSAHQPVLASVQQEVWAELD